MSIKWTKFLAHSKCSVNISHYHSWAAMLYFTLLGWYQYTWWTSSSTANWCEAGWMNNSQLWHKDPVTNTPATMQPTTHHQTRPSVLTAVGCSICWCGLVVDSSSREELLHRIWRVLEASFLRQSKVPEIAKSSKNKITDVPRMKWTQEDRRRWRKGKTGPDRGRSYRLFYNVFIWMTGKTIARIWEVKNHQLGLSKCLRKDSEPSGPSVLRD